MASEVWAVVQQREGKLHRMSLEAVAAAQQVAAASGGSAAAVVLGAGAESAAAELAQCELSAVKVLDHEALSQYTPGAWVGALAPLLEAGEPAYVLFPHTYQTVDFLPRLAQRLKLALVPEAVAFSADEGGLRWRRPILGGKLQAEVRARGNGTVLVSLQSGAYSADDLVKGSAATEAVAAPADLAADREILGVEEVAGEQVDLSQSEVIVAVGRGIGDSDKIGIIEELAEALGAEIGASRPVIDNGWLPRDRQIGSSGQTVTPKLYVAAGISGAIQHLVGMKGAQVVVAINKDGSAPIFNVASYGIVGDLHEVIPALTEAVREAKES